MLLSSKQKAWSYLLRQKEECMGIKRVLLVGGTHGNELTGIYLIKKFEQYPDLIRRSSFETLTLLGNPRAVEACVRYIDQDLNRSFDFQKLKHQDQFSPYENQRAREIKAKFGQAGSTLIDLVIDQHSTTSNVGFMLILDKHDEFTLGLAAYLTSSHTSVKVYSSVGSHRNLDSLRSIAQYQIGIEVGPICHGTLHAELFRDNEAIIQAILDYLEKYNSNTVVLEESPLKLYQYVGVIDYPRNKTGEIQAMIHPQLRDYETLNPGDPMFLTFSGEAIIYQGTLPVNPVFIGESAYMEKGIAMILTQKKQLHLSELIDNSLHKELRH
jgi:succinylglutamate desuccinylase